jgi:serine/threonine protein phosphatase PrpC
MSESPVASLYFCGDMEQPDRHEALSGEVIVVTVRCPDKSTANEDSAAVIASGDGGGVLVVADGMGGGPVGEQASRIAVESLQEAVQERDPELTPLRAAILNGIELANQRILNLGCGAATTLTAAEVQDGVVRPYHVGDSTLLVVGQRGRIKLLTVAHGPVSMALEAGMIDDQEAMLHEDRHVVSNVLGTQEMRIEIGPPISLSRYDTMVLATDGLFDNLSTAEVVQQIRKGSLMKSTMHLLELVRKRMESTAEAVPNKPDDVTLIAYRQK